MPNIKRQTFLNDRKYNQLKMSTKRSYHVERKRELGKKLRNYILYDTVIKFKKQEHLRRDNQTRVFRLVVRNRRTGFS